MTFKPPKYDKYWQLNPQCNYTKQELTDFLVKAGYEVKKSANKDELVQLVHKIRKGRLCYDKFTQPKLKRFAVDRGLVAADKKPTKRWLADTLMDGDDKRTFFQLPDLPPEIRKLIYEFYLLGFQRDTLVEPTQPLLARTCQMTRNEVLPLFYSTCTFQIQFDSMPMSGRKSVRFRITPTSYIFLTTLAPGCLGDLRKVDILFEDKAKVLNWEKCWVDIDLSAGAKLCDTSSNDDGDELEEQCEWMTRGLMKVLKDVSKREERKKLKLQDFYTLCAAVEQVVKHKWARN